MSLCNTGGQYQDDCPRQPFIPIYLQGFVAIFFLLWWCNKCDMCNVVCYCVTAAFFFCWFIAGKTKDLRLTNTLTQAGELCLFLVSQTQCSAAAGSCFQKKLRNSLYTTFSEPKTRQNQRLVTGDFLQKD